VLQQQIDAGKVAAQNAQRLQAAADAVTNAKTQEEQAAALRTYHGLTGKNDMPSQIVKQGSTKTTDAAGMTTSVEPPDRIWNPNTRQYENDGASPAMPATLTPPKTFAQYAAAVRNHPSNKGVKLDDAQLKKDYEARYGAVK
jgi:hypothetical protein